MSALACSASLALARTARTAAPHPLQVSQAAAAIAAQLTGGSKGSKGFAGAGSRKLSVDVPVLESSAAATLQLAQDIIAALPKSLRQQFTIVSCAEDGSGSVAGSGSSGGVQVVSLQACVAQGKDLDGCLLIAGPSTTQASNHPWPACGPPPA